MYMVFCVIDDPYLLNDVLAAWATAGITGATIVECSGIHQRSQHIPMRYAFDSDVTEEGHIGLFAIVADQAAVQACLAATETITGNLDDPNTGVFAAWPLAVVKGVPEAPAE